MHLICNAEQERSSMFRSVEGRHCHLLGSLREGKVSLLSTRGNWMLGEVSAAPCDPNLVVFSESERARAAGRGL